MKKSTLDESVGNIYLFTEFGHKYIRQQSFRIVKLWTQKYKNAEMCNLIKTVHIHTLGRLTHSQFHTH